MFKIDFVCGSINEIWSHVPGDIEIFLVQPQKLLREMC